MCRLFFLPGATKKRTLSSELHNLTDARIVIVAPDSTILASSETADLGLVGTRFSDAAVTQALAGQTAQGIGPGLIAETDQKRADKQPMELILAVLVGFGAAIVAPSLSQLTHKWSGAILALLPLGLTLYFLNLIPLVANGTPVTASIAWVPALDIQLSFYADGLSLLFAVLISGIGAVVILYSSSYLQEHPELGRFYFFILVFMASMLGVVLADNLLLLFIFWELTSISSYFLIGLEHEREPARAAALQALLVTGLGGIALLGGFLLMGQLGGSFEFSALTSGEVNLRSSALYIPILLLVLGGAFTKSAQFPFHFWLPNAMQAPTPVSAYLHSATMVKAGVYLLARLSPMLAGTEGWQWIVEPVGMVTMLLGAYLALQKMDLKQILAYSTVSALGLLMLMLGIGSKLAIEAALVFLLAHALYKGTLFLVAGAIDHETGTRDVRELGGLRLAMPLTAGTALLAALSMAGVPLFLGFIGKELVYEATLDATAEILLTGAVFVTGVLFVAIALIVGYAPFFTARMETPQHPHEAPTAMILGPALLALLGLGLGIFPNAFDAALLASATSAVWGAPLTVKLALWHGITPMLVLSALTIAGGLLVYWLRHAARRVLAPLQTLSRVGPARGYDFALRGLNWAAAAQTRVLQSGYLRHYLMIIIAALVALTGYTLWSHAGLTLSFQNFDLRFYEAGLAVLILLAILTVTTTSSRLTAIAALGVVGYSVALIFLLYGAPDLAMTQFLIETLTVILFVLMFYHLPRFATLTPRRERARDMIVAALGGGLMTALALIGIGVEHDKTVSTFFAENSVVLAHGRNIVNVILVDFRALDTLGEITVLAVAAIGVFALLKLRLAPRQDKG
jgi:multicomponent Na+:H+ antiporter subunit A